jgi:accessory gene regulator protein AgrB
MKKNRYILCMLVGAFLMYFAVPRFSMFAEGLEGIFTASWMLLALLVISGNLSAVLYAPKKKPKTRKLTKQTAKRLRYYA